MKTTHRIIGALWLAISAYFFATRVQGIYEHRPDRADTLTINLFFILLWLSGAFASFYVLTSAWWARIALAVIALLTMAASLLGLFAYLNYPPYSPIGIGFDLFTLLSA